MGNVGIARAIESARAEQSKRTGITADRVLEEIAVIAFLDPGHYKVDLLDGIALTPGAPKSAMRAVGSVKTKQWMHPTKGLVSQTEYRFCDKLGALTQLGRHFKLFTDKLEVDDGAGFADQLRLARERVERGEK